MTDISKRVGLSKEIIGHPHYFVGFSEEEMNENLPVREGEHYDVLAHTDWGGYFVPTVIHWTHGEIDRFTDRQTSLENRERALTE